MNAPMSVIWCVVIDDYKISLPIKVKTQTPDDIFQ